MDILAPCAGCQALEEELSMQASGTFPQLNVPKPKKVNGHKGSRKR